MILWAVLSKLLDGAAVGRDCYQLGLTAAPPNSWDKGCPDKHHIAMYRSESSPNISASQIGVCGGSGIYTGFRSR